MHSLEASSVSSALILPYGLTFEQLFNRLGSLSIFTMQISVGL